MKRSLGKKGRKKRDSCLREGHTNMVHRKR